MKISMIAAVAENGVVGRDNQLPWRLPEDLRYFKSRTMGKAILMGRKTYDSIGRPLPGRTNIVVSRQPGLVIAGAHVVANLNAGMNLATRLQAANESEELMVIGGAEIYAMCLPQAQRLYLTEVAAVVAGDAFFPHWDRSQWQECFRERHPGSGDNPYTYSFVIYQRQ